MSTGIQSKPSFIKSNSVVIITLIILVFANFNIERWKNNDVIKGDITSYYGYLPALFIHHDLSLGFVKKNKDYYAINQMFWPQTSPNGGKVIKTTMGMSMLYAPFFAIAHLEAILSGQSTNGFSTPYHKWIHLSAIFYLLLGLIFLNKFLIKKFSLITSGASILIIFLGTNLFYYSSTEAAMSHVYSFSLISMFIYFFDKWYEHATVRKSVLLGLILGLIVLIRPVNLLIVLFPLFYGVRNLDTLKQNLSLYFQENVKYLLVVIGLAIFISIPQLLYWKIITGFWFFNSYVGERFYFDNPHVTDLLFSFRKGWLLYTPIMVFSLIGFVSLYKKNKELFWGTFSLIIVFVYIYSCWWSWWYGGSFGQRVIIDIYPFLSIPLSALIHLVITQKKRMYAFFFSICLIVLIGHNLFETIQYRRGSIHYDSMTRESYINSVGNISAGEGFYSLLKAPDYQSALEGKEEYSTTK